MRSTYFESRIQAQRSLDEGLSAQVEGAEEVSAGHLWTAEVQSVLNGHACFLHIMKLHKYEKRS